eukprot:scaffold4659_cov125-Isochrysis_galbana.AAC.21
MGAGPCAQWRARFGWATCAVRRCRVHGPTIQTRSHPPYHVTLLPPPHASVKARRPILSHVPNLVVHRCLLRGCTAPLGAGDAFPARLHQRARNLDAVRRRGGGVGHRRHCTQSARRHFEAPRLLDQGGDGPSTRGGWRGRGGLHRARHRRGARATHAQPAAAGAGWSRVRARDAA